MDFSLKSEKTGKKSLLERVNALHERKFGKKPKKKSTEVFTTAEQRLHCRLTHLKEEAYSDRPIPGMDRLKTPTSRGSHGFEDPKTEVVDQSALGRPFKPGDKNTMDHMNRMNWNPETEKEPVEKPVKTQFEQENTVKPEDESRKGKKTITQAELLRESKKPKTKEDKELIHKKALSPKKLRELNTKEFDKRHSPTKDSPVIARAKRHSKKRGYGSYKKALEMLHKEKKALGKEK